MFSDQCDWQDCISFQLNNPSDPCEACIVNFQSIHSKSSEIKIFARYLEANLLYRHRPYFDDLGIGSTKPLPLIQ